MAAVATSAGELDADLVVCAIDPRRLPALARHVERTMPAIPPVVCHLGLTDAETLPDLPHEVVLHGDPMLVVRTGGRAPEGGAAWTVLGRGRLAEDILRALARHRLDVRDRVVVRVDRSPRDLVDDWGGSPLGVLWQGRATVRGAARPDDTGAGRVRRGGARHSRVRAAVRGALGRARRAGRRPGLSPALPQASVQVTVTAPWTAVSPGSRPAPAAFRAIGTGPPAPVGNPSTMATTSPSVRAGEGGQVGGVRPRVVPGGLGRRRARAGGIADVERDAVDHQGVADRVGERGHQVTRLLDRRAADRERVPRLEAGGPALLVVPRPDAEARRRGQQVVLACHLADPLGRRRHPGERVGHPGWRGARWRPGPRRSRGRRWRHRGRSR